MGQTYYEILQVSNDASEEVIRAAYKAQMVKGRKHPDLGGDAEEAKTINEAFEVLSDPRRRADYDTTLGVVPTPKAQKGEAGSERRRVRRHDIDAAVSYCIDHDTKWHAARVVDFSILGLRLRSHETLEVGQQLVVVPPNLAALAMHGTIRWVRVYHPTIFERVYEAGIEFPDQITNIRQRLST